jgi:enterochelin esterase-like enzyme
MISRLARSPLRVARLALVAIALPLAAAGAEAPRGTIASYKMAAPSLHDPQRSVRVYLPASYARAGGLRYPVVFLLHGWPGGDGNWPGSGRAGDMLDSLSTSGRIPEVIAVMPNASGPGLLGRSMYLNSYDGASRMADFIVRDLVAWVDSTFRTRREPRYRGLIGLSEGGSAAVNLAFQHPDVFGACGSHSGDFRLSQGMGEGRILGPDPGASRILAENSPLDYVERIAPRLKGLSIYFDCGRDDGDEMKDNRELHDKLTALGLPHTFNEFPGGHTWGYWRSHLHESLIAVTANMR